MGIITTDKDLRIFWDEFKNEHEGTLTADLENLMTNNKTVVGAINELLHTVYGKAGFCVGAWNDSSTSPTAETILGDKNFALAWYPFLINHNTPASIDGSVKPTAQLKKNNWFRTVDGNFSPAVSISQDSYNAVDGKDLYKKVNGELVKAYDSTLTFDHISYYNENGVEPLFDSEGNEVYVRKPWETTSTDYSIMIGRKEAINVIDNVVGNSGKKLRGVLGEGKKEYQGFNLTPYYLKPTGICPSPSGTISNKIRNFFIPIANIGDTESRGSAGLGSRVSRWSGDGLYPRSLDATQITNMNWARANNSTNTLSYPWAEGGYNVLNAFLCSLEAAYGTKFLHSASMFSSGTSSNDSISNETSWKNYGGVRYKLKSENSWSYTTFSTNTPFYYNTTGSRTSWTETLNYRKALWRVNEAGTVASYAVEREIQDGEEFTFMGKTYWYKNIGGQVENLLDGEMNARVYRKEVIEISAYDASGNTVEYDAEIIMRAGVMNGVDASGDVNVYFGGGYELLGDSDNRVIYPYFEPDQKKWERLTSYNTVSVGGTWGIENKYIALTSLPTSVLTNGYTLKQDPYVPAKSSNGGAINTGECHYTYGAVNWASAGKLIRVGLRFRGSALATYASPRLLSSITPAGYTFRYSSCSAQVLLDVQRL